MNAILLWSLLLATGNQQMPAEYYQLPAEIRAKATLVIRGDYGTGRTPCIWRPDGTRVWLKDSWFNVRQVYEGQSRTKSIHINTAMMPKSEFIAELKDGQEYLVLLNPSAESQRLLESDQGQSFREALHDDELVAIVKLEKQPQRR